MATRSAKEADARESREDAAGSPVLDSLTAAARTMIARGKERGYVTYDELNAALPPEEVSSEQIEDTMTMISEIGINVTEIEDADDGAPEERTATGSAGAATVEEDDLGRTDDPVRMYLREMGSVELLSREGEIAIAKRIEAGRQTMISSICESPLTMRAVIEWRDALKDGTMLLRDVIDLEATYGELPEAWNGGRGAVVELRDRPGQKVDLAGDQEAPADARREASIGEAKSGASASEDDEDFDEGNVSLATMEEAVRPQVIETIDAIAAAFTKFRRLQDQRLDLALKNEALSPSQARRYDRLKRELVQLMDFRLRRAAGLGSRI